MLHGKRSQWDYSLRLQKNKGRLNNNNLKNNRTPRVLIEPFLKYSKKITLTHTLSLSLICGDEVQETATFLQLT